ncbi:MAG: hypothetical protein ACXVNM_11000 [Bacteroidia bacterium]
MKLKGTNKIYFIALALFLSKHSFSQSKYNVDIFSGRARTIFFNITRESSTVEDNLQDFISIKGILADDSSETLGYRITDLNSNYIGKYFPIDFILSYTFQFKKSYGVSSIIIQNDMNELYKKLKEVNKHYGDDSLVPINSEIINIYSPEAFINKLYLPYVSRISAYINCQLMDTTTKTLICHPPDSTIARCDTKLLKERDTIIIQRSISTDSSEATKFLNERYKKLYAFGPSYNLKYIPTQIKEKVLGKKELKTEKWIITHIESEAIFNYRNKGFPFSGREKVVITLNNKSN